MFVCVCVCVRACARARMRARMHIFDCPSLSRVHISCDMLISQLSFVSFFLTPLNPCCGWRLVGYLASSSDVGGGFSNE